MPKLKREPTPLERHEANVVASASTFVACNFRGRARYEKSEHSSLGAAVAAARAMIDRRPADDIANRGRPVLVYAVHGVHSVVAQVVRP